MLQGTSCEPKCDERQIFDLFAAQVQTRVTEIALRIGMFEALKEPSEVAALASTLTIGRRATECLLTVLSAAQLVEISASAVGLTDIAREYLLSESPFFKGALFQNISSDEINLLQKVHLQDDTPRPITKQWLAGRVLKADSQAEVMHAHSFAAASVFARQPIFQQVGRILDVAGGVGSVSISLALKNPHLRCSVMDLPSMASLARSFSERFGVADRVTFIGNNIFSGEWPAGYDAVILSNVLHDWDHCRCKDLIEKAFRAIPVGGRIFVNEMLLNEDRRGPIGPALFSAVMLLFTEGQQFTFSELATLLELAGFQRVVSLARFGYYSLVTAEK